MQWEYHIEMRTRAILRASIGTTAGAMISEDWQPRADAFLATVAQLGLDRWELVSISTRTSLNHSPMTSEEVWVFKRPIE